MNGVVQWYGGVKQYDGDGVGQYGGVRVPEDLISNGVSEAKGSDPMPKGLPS